MYEIKLTSARFDTFKKYFVSYTYHFANGLTLVSIIIYWYNEHDKYEIKYFLDISKRAEINFVSPLHIYIYILFL